MKRPDFDPDKTLPPVGGPNETMPFPAGLSFDDILERIQQNDVELKGYVEQALRGLFGHAVRVEDLSYDFGRQQFDVKFKVAGESKHLAVETKEPPALEEAA